MGLGASPGLVAWLWVGRGARKEGRSIHEPGRGKLTPKHWESGGLGSCPIHVTFSLILGVFSGPHSPLPREMDGTGCLLEVSLF